MTVCNLGQASSAPNSYIPVSGARPCLGPHSATLTGRGFQIPYGLGASSLSDAKILSSLGSL